MNNLNKPCPVCNSTDIILETYTTLKGSYYRRVCSKSCCKGAWSNNSLQASKYWNTQRYSDTDAPNA